MKPATYSQTTKNQFAHNNTKNNLFALSIVLIAALFAAYLIEIRGYAISDNGVSPAASVIVVNSLSDAANPSDGFCTLREAITAANTNTASGAAAGECVAGSSGSDVINISVTGNITLRTVLPDIITDMNIIGPGSSRLGIGNVGDVGFSKTLRIFKIKSATVGLSGLGAAWGQLETFDREPGGGGIWNSGTLTLTDVNIFGNKTAEAAGGAGGGNGGGIFNQGTLTMTNCTVAENRTVQGPYGASGGGIYNSGTLNMTNCVVSGNYAVQDAYEGLGGGIYNSGTLNMTNCVVNGNYTAVFGASKLSGGGIFNIGTMTLTNTTISNNGTGSQIYQVLPPGDGAGIYNSGQNASLVNCTVSGNKTGPSGKVGGIGGGIYNTSSLIIIGTTISGNDGDSAGGIYNSSTLKMMNSTISDNRKAGLFNTISGTARLTNCTVTKSQRNGVTGGLTYLRNNILAGNGADDFSGQCVSLGHNLIGFSSLSCFANGVNNDQIGTGGSPLNAQLGPLANHSGPTMTHALLPNSPALDAGDNCVTQPAHCGDADIPTLTTDQRGNGFSRIVDGPDVDTTATVDIGAYELQGPLANLADSSTNEDTTFAISFDDSAIASVTATSSNPALVPNDAAHLNAGINYWVGTVTINPALDQSGTTNITVTANRTGGSESKTFLLTVNPVNDAPSFTKGADQTVSNTAGTQTVTNWATKISPGPVNESSQTVSFQVNNDNPGLFAVGPAISSTGTLTYTPSTSGGGTATVSVTLKDNGGTSNGGVDSSPSQAFTITVTPVGGFVNFAASSSNTTENSGSVTVNVVRTGNTSSAATVNYATNSDPGVPCSTANGVASPKCDFTAELGTLNFAVGETNKSITVLLSQDSFVEGPENITLTLSNQTGGSALGTSPSMSITIADDVTEPPANIIDEANMFVRMHYHDFLNREGDQSGIGFWTGQMTNCGASDLLVCRVNVSGAFFLSIEFQQTGYLVERMYRTAYGQATATSNLGGAHLVLVPMVRANEFLADTQRLGRGVVVLQPGWEQVLENNKQAYALEFVQTPRFITALPTSRTPTQFVDQLNQNAGMVLSPGERAAAINLFGIAVDTTNVNARAQVLRQIAEDQDLYNAEFNRAFVLAEYIGYLRRNPDDAPEVSLDYTGYEFWLNKLNENGGDYIKAEMVKAFISSSEYRQRFGP